MWDYKRPYVPTKGDMVPCISTTWGVEPDESQVDEIYRSGSVTIGRDGLQEYTFIPFNGVRMRLIPTHMRTGVEPKGMFLEDVDTGNAYFMFERTFSDMMNATSQMSWPIDGFWWAEKQNLTYGVRLAAVADGDSAVRIGDPEIGRRFSYHKPNDEQKEMYESIRHIARDFATCIVDLCPNNMEKSNAVNALDMAVMWANASIARSTR